MADSDFVERLTPLDLLMPAGYVGALLTFSTEHLPTDLLHSLQQSLALACNRIPWIKGRVYSTPLTQDEKPGLEIRWSATDAAPSIIDHGSIAKGYDNLAAQGIPLEEIPTHVWPAPAQPGDGSPVFAASFFRFADGKAIGLCVQTHHNVVDGFGFQEIVNIWARLMKDPETAAGETGGSSENASRLAQALQQSYANASSLSLDELFERHPEYRRNPALAHFDPSVCTSEVLCIPMARIDALKESLRPHLGAAPTTNTVACALTWSAITRARIRQNPELADKTSRIPMAVNGRKRLDPSLLNRQDPYVRNVVLYSFAEAAAREVSAAGPEGSGLEPLAKLCRLVSDAQSQQRINAAHIAEVYSLVEKVENHRGIWPGWELFGPRDLFITSWADLDLYEHDFGERLGKPQFVRIPYVQMDGNVIILPRVRDMARDASTRLEVVVMLQKETLQLLKEDALWEARAWLGLCISRKSSNCAGKD